MDPYKFLHIVLNPDGTITRLEKHHKLPPNPIPTLTFPFSPKISPLIRYVTLGSYLPSPSSTGPLFIIFYHQASHDCLLPRRRLHRLRRKHHLLPRLLRSNCSKNPIRPRFCELPPAPSTRPPMHMMMLWSVALDPNLRGKVVDITSSEERLANDTILPPPVTDLVWELYYTVGADRDHEYSNPTPEKGSKVFDNITRLGWKVLVFGSYGDLLIDRQIDLAKSLQKHDAHVEGHFKGEDKHGAFGGQPTKGRAIELYDAMNKLFTTNY
ncbi:hypothetical protein K1719_039814 [Acacia pycnantha]|nr:hypothetical protein K1719_039814 [Acacia pycnantha]